MSHMSHVTHRSCDTHTCIFRAQSSCSNLCVTYDLQMTTDAMATGCALKATTTHHIYCLMGLLCLILSRYIHMYLYTHLYMYVFLYVKVYMYTYMCIYVYTYLYKCTYTYMHMYTYIQIQTFLSCIYKYKHACIYIYTNTNIHDRCKCDWVRP